MVDGQINGWMKKHLTD